jgi:tetratricopeptide (TPR) repeat protein
MNQRGERDMPGRENGVGKRLRELRLAKGLTQQDLAGQAYTAAYVSTIESGKRTPSSVALAYFADRLQVEPEEILTGRPPNLALKLELDVQDARMILSDGRYEEADAIFSEVAEAARQYGLGRSEAKALEGRGLVAERSGSPEVGLEHFERAGQLLETEPPPLRVEAVAGVARCTQMMGDVRYAIHILESFLMHLRDIPDPLALMRIYSSLVWPYTEVGLYTKAAQAATEALRLEARVDEPEQIANMHVNVARELLRQNRSDEALASLRRAETIYVSLEWKTEVARAHLARAIVFTDQGSLHEARSCLQKALEVFRQTRSNLNQARALNELARVERSSGQSGEARRLLEESIALLQEGDVAELAVAHREMALAMVDETPELAEKNFRIAIDLYRQADESLQAAAVYRQLGDLLFRRGDVSGSRESYREGLIALEPP